MLTNNQLPGIAYRFNNPELLREALTHRSHGSHNNERLEFLGDSILNFVVASTLYEAKPDTSEGGLSRLRSRVVRGETLADLAAGLNLGDHLIMGEGEMKTGGFRRRSILADTLEALFGAIYLDGGFEACELVIQAVCKDVIANLPAADELKDPKTRLQEWMQARGRPLPNYDLILEEGAEHAKRFSIRVRLPGSDMEVEAIGDSRRKAEQAAAAKMLKEIKET